MKVHVIPKRKDNLEKDYGNIKILFIGLSDSTHTHAWIDLLEGSQVERRLFALPSGNPPDAWPVKTYVTAFSNRKNSSTREYLNTGLFVRLRFVLTSLIDVKTNKLNYKITKAIIFLLTPLLNLLPTSFIVDKFAKRTGSDKFGAEIWLNYIIRDWKPDIIHTLGLFDNQGGMFYYDVRKKFHLEGNGIWVQQLRGGSDISLKRYDRENVKQLSDILSDCDQVITDNYFNIEYIRHLGFADKIASIAPVPGTGGVDIDTNPQNIVRPSERQRLIFWPKAYETIWSKALPIIEAIKLAWDQIKPCTICITATNSESEVWLTTLPEEIRKNCHIQTRIPREEVFEMMRNARVMLAPSLVDGVPNVLYEAMANGAFPIVSPLETIAPVVKQNENVIFARNLYPEEISNALIRAMNDDILIDKAAENNLKLVESIADRRAISAKIINYYISLLDTM